MISFDEAFALAGSAGDLLGMETVPIRQAHRRVLADPVSALVNSPSADVSAMDGYAVREHDLIRIPAALPIAGESFAGRPFVGELPAGCCVRIFTGAAVPSGADRVIVQEVVTSDGRVAKFEQPLSLDRHIRRKGSDFACGDQLLASGTLLTPGALVAAAGADLSELRVARRPRLHLLSTGDELVEPGSARSSSLAIPESVSVGVAAISERWGGVVESIQRLPDDLATMERAASEAPDLADLIVVTGGASVGQKDFAKTMFEGTGLQVIFSKVAIKPGKPVWLARSRGRLVLGLPGNPTSALVTARLFLAPLLCVLTGRDPREAADWRAMRVGHALDATGDRETFSRGYAKGDAVHLFDQQDSGSQKVLAHASLLIRRLPRALPLPAGDWVHVLEF